MAPIRQDLACLLKQNLGLTEEPSISPLSSAKHQEVEVVETGKEKIRPKSSQSCLPFIGKGLELGLGLFWSFQGFSKET